MSEQEAVSLYLWSGDNAAKTVPDGTFPFELIGSSLRTMAHGETPEKWRKVEAIVAGVSRALEKLPEPRVPEVFRGFRMVDGAFREAHLEEKAVIQYNSFTSFTTDIEVAKVFAGDKGWLMVIRKPRQVREIGVYSAIPSGAEILTPMLRQYRVVTVDEDAHVIEAEEILANERQPVSAHRNFSSSEEHDAWWQDVLRRIKEARNDSKPLTDAQQMAVNHMLYG